jgi:hypothetical protein
LKTTGQSGSMVAKVLIKYLSLCWLRYFHLPFYLSVLKGFPSIRILSNFLAVTSPHQAIRNVVSRVAHHAESQSLVPVSQFGIFQVLLAPQISAITHSGWFIHENIFRNQLRKILVRSYQDFVVFFSACFAIVPIRSSASNTFHFYDWDVHGTRNSCMERLFL